MGFLRKLFRTHERPVQQPIRPRTASPNDNLAVIAQTLRRVQAEGGQGNFCIFVADSDKNYYIQFAAQANDAALYAEASGNQVLKPNAKLTESQHQRLLAAGWHTQSPEVDGSYSREWTAFDDVDRHAIATIVLDTLTQIYGMLPGRPIEVKLGLQ